MTAVEQLSEHVTVEVDGDIAIVVLDRPHKRNALDGGTVRALGSFFAEPPSHIRVGVLSSSGDHFSAGLDLNELSETDAFEGIKHSRGWHRAFDAIEFGAIPVISVLRGAVIGGGLELAMTTHVRVAEPSAFYALPEGSRGIFVGGGASVRLPRLIGVPRMTDMMLTGRVLDAVEGQQAGITQYLTDDGNGLTQALELARTIASNSPVSNYAVLQALPRIAEMSKGDGLFVESLMAAIAQGSEQAKALMQEFLEGRSNKVGADRGSAR